MRRLHKTLVKSRARRGRMRSGDAPLAYNARLRTEQDEAREENPREFTKT